VCSLVGSGSTLNKRKKEKKILPRQARDMDNPLIQDDKNINCFNIIKQILSVISNEAQRMGKLHKNLKSAGLNIEYNFNRSQPYLSRVFNLSRGSNPLNSASGNRKTIYIFDLYIYSKS